MDTNTEPPIRYRRMSFYANIGKVKKRYYTTEPVLVSVTKDSPSKAKNVIASVHVVINVPESWLRDGPLMFSAEYNLNQDPRERHGVIVDLMEETVPPLVTEVPAQEPVE